MVAFGFGGFVISLFISSFTFAQSVPGFSGAGLQPELQKLRNLAQKSNSCLLATMKHEGYGVCFTGSPASLQAIVECDTADPFWIYLEDPHYHACPPAKLISYNLGNASVSDAHRKAWDALQDYSERARMTPYHLFRTDLIQTLKASGLVLDGPSINKVRIDRTGADFSVRFDRK